MTTGSAPGASSVFGEVAAEYRLHAQRPQEIPRHHAAAVAFGATVAGDHRRADVVTGEFFERFLVRVQLDDSRRTEARSSDSRDLGSAANTEYRRSASGNGGGWRDVVLMMP